MIATMSGSGSAGHIEQKPSPNGRWDRLIGKGVVMLVFSIGMGIWYAEDNQVDLERADQLTEEAYRAALVEEQQAKIRNRPTSWPAAMTVMALIWCLIYLPYEFLCWLAYQWVRWVRE